MQAIEGQPLKAVNIPWIPEVDPDEVINTLGGKCKLKIRNLII